jgi:chemotaxis response regulator CheB
MIELRGSAEDLRGSFRIEEARIMLQDVALPSDSVLPCFVIVAASGGSEAFDEVLASLRPPFPPITAIQAIHPNFMAKFAEWLRRIGSLDVKIVAEGDLVLPDRVLLAAGDSHAQLAMRTPRVWVMPGHDGPDVIRGDGHRERAFDLTFASAARKLSRAEGDKSIARSGRWPCRASAVEW